MARSGVSDPAGDVRHWPRTGVHHDDGRNGGRREMVVDLGGVEARDGNGRKELVKQIGAGFRPAR